MTVPVVRFQLDPTGTNPNNLVTNEPHSLDTNVQIRAIAPTYGPFYEAGLVITDSATNTALSSSQYSLVELLQDATMLFGQGIYGVILITDSAVSSSVSITYQSLGGEYQSSSAGVINAYQTLIGDNRPVDWVNVLNKPAQYPPTLHEHLLSDVYGFQTIVAALERVKNAIVLNNIPPLNALVTWMNGLFTTTNNAIVAETNRAETEEANLQTELNTETAARISGDSNLQTELNTETAARIAGDATLQTELNAEIAARIKDVASNSGVLSIRFNTEGLVSAGQELLNYTAIENIVFLPNMAGSSVTCQNNATSECVFNILVNGIAVGSLIFSPEYSSGYFNTMGFSLSAGQQLAIYSGNSDATLNYISGNITGVPVQLIGQNQQPYLLSAGFRDSSAGNILLQYTASTGMSFPYNLVGSSGFAEIPAVNETTIDVLKNNVQIGSIIFVAGYQKPFFNVPEITLSFGDVLTLRENMTFSDPYIANVSLSLFGIVNNAVSGADVYDVFGGFDNYPEADQVLLKMVSLRTITFPSNLTGSGAIAATPANNTSNSTFTIYANGINVGTIVFTAGSTNAMLYSAGFTLQPGQTLYIVGSSVPDSSLSNVSLTLSGVVNYTGNLIPFDIYGGIAQVPTANEAILNFTSTIVINFKLDSLMYATADVAATNFTTMEVLINNYSVGTLTFAAGSTTGIFNTNLTYLNPGQVLTILNSSTPDPTLAGINIAIAGSISPSLNNSSYLSSILPTIPSSGINTPSIVGPAAGSTNEPTSLTITSSAYSTYGTPDTQASASWQLATDSGFANIVLSNMASTSYLNSWPISGLNKDTTYYVRVQYTGTNYPTSAWSAADSFTTVPFIATPSIISPANGSTGNNTSMTINGSSFTVVGGTDTQTSSNWQLATDSAFTNIVVQSMNDTVNLTSWPVSGLSYSTTYYTRVQYTGATYGTSSWSAIDVFATMAVPILDIGVFGGGYNTAASSNTSVYTYSSNAVVSGSVLTYSSYLLAASGNANVGIFAGGFIAAPSSNTSIYTYSTNTVTTGGNLSYGVYSLAAAGNSTVGVFGAGNNGSGVISTTSIYIYSSNTAIAGGVLGYAAYSLAAVGNSTTGVFGGGSGSSAYMSNTSTYTYSNNTSATGGNLSYTVSEEAAAGNTSIGVFGGGSDAGSVSTTSIYTYSSNTTVTGGNISYFVIELAAVGNPSVGVFGSGNGATSNMSTTSVYTYSSNTSVLGGNLTYGSFGLAACGPNSGVNA